MHVLIYMFLQEAYLILAVTSVEVLISLDSVAMLKHVFKSAAIKTKLLFQ